MHIFKELRPTDFDLIVWQNTSSTVTSKTAQCLILNRGFRLLWELDVDFKQNSLKAGNLISRLESKNMTLPQSSESIACIIMH